MRNNLIGLIAIFVSLSVAADWRKLDDEQIVQTLSGVQIAYKGEFKTYQDFYADGKTVYIEGRPSNGNWRVSDSQYCSQWPPALNWTCYDVFRKNQSEWIRFVNKKGQIWEGLIQMKTL